MEYKIYIYVFRLVKLIKSGNVYTSEQRRLNELKKPEDSEGVEDIWEDSIYDVDPTTAKRSVKNEIKPPKIELPSNSESYNPPEEYLLNEEVFFTLIIYSSICITINEVYNFIRKPRSGKKRQTMKGQ